MVGPPCCYAHSQPQHCSAPWRRYQRKRMYTRIALGKSSAMDVVGGESSGMPGQLLALLPGLFVLQAWQIWLGGSMMTHTARAVTDSRGWLVRALASEVALHFCCSVRGTCRPPTSCALESRCKSIAQCW
jgi:TMPIT-like protein